MGCIIFLNEVVAEIEQEKQYKVLWISPDLVYGYWIRMDDNKLPEKFEYNLLEEGLSSGRFEKKEEISSETSDIGISESSKKRRDELWEALQNALTHEPDIYDRKRRKELLQEPAKKLGTPYNNLYRYLVRYWKNGKTPNAFLIDRRKSGKKAGINGCQKKQGRPAKHEGGFGKALNSDDIKNFSKAVKKYYLTQKKATLVSTYEKMLADDYTIMNGTGQLALLPSDQIPSIRQFRYWFQKSFDIKTVKQKRDGDAKFELTGRAITGRSDYQLMGPGAKYQIDATVGDIYLV